MKAIYQERKICVDCGEIWTDENEDMNFCPSCDGILKPIIFDDEN